VGYGDSLMLTAEAREVKRAIGIPATPSYWDDQIFDGNPNLAKEGGMPLRNTINNRPYHLGAVRTQYGTKVIFNPNFRAVPGEIYGIKKTTPSKHWVVIEPHFKPELFGANKDWGWEKYRKLVDLLPNHFIQMSDNPNAELLSENVHFRHTPTFRDAIRHLASAKLYIGPEGGLHHAAAALGIPAVVIFGGHTSPKTTGYDMHINLASDDAGCGNMFPCGHCRKAMDEITVEMVIEAAESLL